MLLQAISVMVDVVCAFSSLAALCGRKGGYLESIIEKKVEILIYLQWR